MRNILGGRPERCLVATLALLLALGQVRPAFAIDETTRVLLRKLSSDGVAAYQQGDYVRAVERLEKAWSILHTAPLGLWSGRALEKSGRLVAASERYLEAKRAPLDSAGDRDAQESARVDAEKAYQDIQPRIPTVTVQIRGASPQDLSITVAKRTILADFIGLPVPVDPGTIEIMAQSNGGVTETASVTLREGEHEEVTLTFASGAVPVAVTPEANEATAKDEPARDPGGKRGWQPVAGWIGVGLGSAGLVVGGVTGGIVLSKWDELDCADGAMCNATPEETAPINDLRTVSTIGFIAGGVLTAAGITLLLTAPKKTRELAVRPYFNIDSLGVVGSF